jgi:starch-binding outer membrane protein, SusD/RagB family
MNMKKYKFITIALFVLVAFNSCNDFLTTDLTDAKKTDVTFYKTPSDAFDALVGCYNGLNLFTDGGFPVISEVFSDDCFGGTGSSDGYGYQMMDEFNPSVSPSDVSLYSKNWKAYYQAINRCNTLLDKIGQVTWDTVNLQTQFEGEAKFIRAFCYFDMVRLWEKVPLVSNVITDGNYNIPQAEPAETYAQIISDLRFAVDNLPATPYSSTIISGRVTKWAAEALLARVFLFYTGYYGVSTIGGETEATALAAVEDVIQHSNHGLVADFATLWPAAAASKGVGYIGENNKEVVFAIKYSSTQDYNGNITGNSWMVMMGMREESHYPYQYGWGACTVDPKLWDFFDPSDARRPASIISIVGESIDFTKAGANREYTGYYIKKYASLCDINGVSVAKDFMIGQDQDYFAIRYSDVLLMAAELGSANAQDYLDQVRLRAGLTSVPVTHESIMDERRLEFAGEGIRYWDLLRQGVPIAAQTIDDNTTYSIMNYSGNLPNPGYLNANITATRGFQQIPNDQITLSSGVLKQNAGWERNN